MLLHSLYRSVFINSHWYQVIVILHIGNREGGDELLVTCQGFFIYPFTFGVLCCGEQVVGKGVLFLQELKEVSWGSEMGKSRETWMHMALRHGLRLSDLHKPIEHCSESLWFKMSLLDSQCTNISLIAKGT